MLTNRTVSLVATNDIRDIRPPVVIPSGWAWVGWTLLVLAVAAVAFFFWRWWQKRRIIQAIIPPLPPHERARRKLEAALGLFDQPKPFCILVSDAVRLYLEERFNLNAPERTTEEFLTELKTSASLSRAQKEGLQRFLTACDLVKFARHQPGRVELEGLYAAALRLIEETEPKPEPTGGSATVVNSGANGNGDKQDGATNGRLPTADGQPSAAWRQSEFVNRQS